MTLRSTFKKIMVGLVPVVICLACLAQVNANPIEEMYASTGPYSTSRVNQDGFSIFYPAELDGNHPIIAFGNGTWAPTLAYAPLLNHFASWGFVVIDSNGMMTQNGSQLVSGIDYLIEQNTSPDSQFYGKIDTDHIGTSGHSQGGGGALNAATDSRVVCTVPLAPSPSGHIRQVGCPMFLVAGENDSVISTAQVKRTNFARSKSPTILGIVDGMDHLDFIGDAGAARGYITAWFMFYLMEDDYAGEAFTGSCEICENTGWTIEMKAYP